MGKPLVSAGLADLKKQFALCFELLGFERDKESLAHFAFKKREQDRIIRVSSSIRISNQFVGVDNVSFRRYQGLVLSLRLSTPLKTRLIVAPPSSRFLSFILSGRKKKLGLKPIPLPDWGFDPYEVSAVDEDWTRQFLGNNLVRQIMRSWIKESDDRPAFVFTPELMAITLSPAAEEIKPQVARKWIDSALTLITLAEAIPTTVTVEMTKQEREVLENPRLAVIKLVAKLFGFAIGALFLFGLFLFLAGPIAGIIFLLFFMPVAFVMAATRFLRAISRNRRS